MFKGIVELLNSNGRNYYKIIIYPHIFFCFVTNVNSLVMSFNASIYWFLLICYFKREGKPLYGISEIGIIKDIESIDDNFIGYFSLI